jgi:hypothetical protein
MGTSLHVVVEYDDALLYNPALAEQPAFASIPEVISFFDYVRLRSGKDSRFFAVLGWVTKESRREALFALRGLPQNISQEAAQLFDQFYDPDSYGLGWLTREEVGLAIEHMGFDRNDLSLAVNVVLEAMDCLVRRVGSNRVRLVFGLD